MHEIEYAINGPPLIIRAYGPEEVRRMNGSVHDRELSPEFATHVTHVLDEMGVDAAYAPFTSVSSALVVENARKLSERVRLSPKISLFRKRRLPTDGLFLEHPGEAVVMETNGPLILASMRHNYVLVAHAGLNSLLDRGVVLQNKSALRAHLSVVDYLYDALVERLKERDEVTTGINACLLLATPEDECAIPLTSAHGSDNTYAHDLREYLMREHPQAVSWREDKLFFNLAEIFLKQASAKHFVKTDVLHTMREFPDLARACSDDHNLVIVAMREERSLSRAENT